MRIAFLVQWRSGRTSGIYRKIADQAAAWASAGHDVGLFVATSDEAANDWDKVFALEPKNDARRASDPGPFEGTSESAGANLGSR